MQRMPGFYWVQVYSNSWVVAELIAGDTWYLCGIRKAVSESEFKAIDENMLIR